MIDDNRFRPQTMEFLISKMRWYKELNYLFRFSGNKNRSLSKTKLTTKMITGYFIFILAPIIFFASVYNTELFKQYFEGILKKRIGTG